MDTYIKYHHQLLSSTSHWHDYDLSKILHDDRDCSIRWHVLRENPSIPYQHLSRLCVLYFLAVGYQWSNHLLRLLSLLHAYIFCPSPSLLLNSFFNIDNLILICFLILVNLFLSFIIILLDCSFCWLSVRHNWY